MSTQTKNGLKGLSQTLIDCYNSDVYSGITYAESLRLPYPDKPTKPVLKKDHNSKDLAEYSVLLSAWEEKMNDYTKDKGAYQIRSAEIDSSIESFIKDVSGFDSTVPDDKKDKVWSKAWSDGHSCGYGEVYGCLCGLVELFS